MIATSKRSTRDVQYRRLKILAALHVPNEGEPERLPPPQQAALVELVRSLHPHLASGNDIGQFTELCRELRRHEAVLALCDDERIDAQLCAEAQRAAERLDDVVASVERLSALEAEGTADDRDILDLIDLEDNLARAKERLSEAQRALSNHRAQLGRRRLHEKHAQRLMRELFDAEIPA